MGRAVVNDSPPPFAFTAGQLLRGGFSFVEGGDVEEEDEAMED